MIEIQNGFLFGIGFVGAVQVLYNLERIFKGIKKAMAPPKRWKGTV